MPSEQPPLLEGMTIFEVSAFVAAPLGGATLAGLGADVIRIDPPRGGADFKRWPLARSGDSLYWAGLNKGKRSVTIDYARPEGRELLLTLLTAPGKDAGILITNLAGLTWLDYPELVKRRADMISLRIDGNFDGTTAVDYTVNAAVGIPAITGRGGEAEPTNHVLPAWDIATGLYAATAILAADRRRARSSQGAQISLALSDVALAVLSHLGFLGEAELGAVRPALGNDVFGVFGRDFPTRDGRRVMLVAVTERHWQAIAKATQLPLDLAQITTDGERFARRDAIGAHVGAWSAARSFGEVAAALNAARACWGPYQSMQQLLADDPRASLANPMFARVAQPSFGHLLTAASPAAVHGSGRAHHLLGPRLGEHTHEVLSQRLGLDAAELVRLTSAGLIGLSAKA